MYYQLFELLNCRTNWFKPNTNLEYTHPKLS